MRVSMWTFTHTSEPEVKRSFKCFSRTGSLLGCNCMSTDLPTHTVPVFLHDLPEEANNFVSLLTFNVAGTKGGSLSLHLSQYEIWRGKPCTCFGRTTGRNPSSPPTRSMPITWWVSEIVSLGGMCVSCPDIDYHFGSGLVSNIFRIIPLSQVLLQSLPNLQPVGLHLEYQIPKILVSKFKMFREAGIAALGHSSRASPTWPKMCLTSVTVTILMSSRFLAKWLQPNLRSEWPAT